MIDLLHVPGFDRRHTKYGADAQIPGGSPAQEEVNPRRGELICLALLTTRFRVLHESLRPHTQTFKRVSPLKVCCYQSTMKIIVFCMMAILTKPQNLG